MIIWCRESALSHRRGVSWVFLAVSVEAANWENVHDTKLGWNKKEQVRQFFVCFYVTTVKPARFSYLVKTKCNKTKPEYRNNHTNNIFPG